MALPDCHPDRTPTPIAYTDSHRRHRPTLAPTKRTRPSSGFQRDNRLIFLVCQGKAVAHAMFRQWIVIGAVADTTAPTTIIAV